MGIIGNYMVIRPENHAAWLEERKKGLGSSDAGTIMGVNNFDTPLKLWRRRRGLDAPTEETDVMALGHAVEGGVAYMFARATGAIIDESSAIDWMAVSREKPYLRVSPDRLFWPAGTPPEQRDLAHACMLECKTTSHFIDKNDIQNTMPQYWYCQIQYQMGILGLPKCAIGWISAAGGRFSFDFAWVDFNRGFFEYMISRIDAFWKLCVDGVEPQEIMDEDDLRTRYPASVKDKTLELFSDVPEDRDFINLAKEYAELNNQCKELDARKNEIKITLGSRIADNEKVTFDDVKVLSFASQRGKSSLDAKRLKEDHPDLYDEYMSEGSTFRVFKVLPKLSEVQLNS